jgi:hypothetical protein
VHFEARLRNIAVPLALKISLLTRTTQVIPLHEGPMEGRWVSRHEDVIRGGACGDG